MPLSQLFSRNGSLRITFFHSSPSFILSDHFLILSLVHIAGPLDGTQGLEAYFLLAHTAAHHFEGLAERGIGCDEDVGRYHRGYVHRPFTG